MSEQTIVRWIDGRIPVVIKLSVWERARELYSQGKRTLPGTLKVMRTLVNEGVSKAHAAEVAVLAREE